MKILITGINGLVGSFAAKRLIDEGHEIYGLVRENADLGLLLAIKHKITFIIGDILDIPNLEKAIKNMDWVIHSAAVVSFLPKDRDLLFKVNVEGTANMVNVCLENNIKKLVFISSVAALGRKQKLEEIEKMTPIFISEENDWVESSDNSNYAKSKYLAELEVWRGISEGLTAIILNPSNILGEADWTKSSTKLFKYVFDQNLFYTDGSLNYIDVEDLTEIISKLLNSNIINERFIISANSISQIDFFKAIANNFSKNPPKYKLGNTAISVLWRLEAIKAKLLGKEPLITRETARSAKTHFIYKNDKIKSTINYEFKPFHESLKRICESLAEKYS
jgi:dihydroflavonol-4-reductase